MTRIKSHKVGDRIEDSFLGTGTVVRLIRRYAGLPPLYSVLFDETPAYEYNLGKNPCLWWPDCHDPAKDKGAE
jgi:hypothetical protein